MTSIYNISQEYIDLLNALEQQDGELTPEQEQALVINRENFENKAVGYGHIIRKKNNDIALIEAEMQVVKAELDRLKERVEKEKTTIEAMKERIKEAMLLYGIEKVEHALFSLSFRSSEAVIVENQDSLPLEYLRTIIKTEPDKTLIKKAITEGKEVLGAYIEKRKNLQYK